MDILQHCQKYGFNEMDISSQREGRLSITTEKFNQVAKAEIPEDMVKSLKGFDYMNVAHAIWMVKQFYPTLTPKFVRNAEGDPFIDLPGDRGTMLGICFEDSVTLCTTQIHWFPVMGRSVKGAIKPAEIEPDARSINDNMARAIAKAAAYFLGVGFSIFSRIEGDALEEAELGVAPKPVKETTKTKFRTSKEEEPEEDEDDLEDEDDEEDDEEDEEVEEARNERVSRRTTSKYSNKTRMPYRGGRK